MTPERYSLYRGTRWQRLAGWCRMWRAGAVRWLRKWSLAIIPRIRRRGLPSQVQQELYGKRAPGCGEVRPYRPAQRPRPWRF